jgi:hypothetical protein
MSKNTAATGGQVAPQQPSPAQVAEPKTYMGATYGADDVPNLADPTQRPGEPVTAGLDIGAGPGREALGILPPPRTDPIRQVVEALYLIAPNPDLARLQARLDYEGR